jgi:hypothetical protein
MHHQEALTSPLRVITWFTHGCTGRHRDSEEYQYEGRQIPSCHVFIPSNYANVHLSNALQSTFKLKLLFLLILRFSSMPSFSPGNSPLPPSNHL